MTFVVAILAFMACVSPGVALAAPPLSAYGNLRGFERAALSPSGNHVALVGIAKAQRMLLVVDAAGKITFRDSSGNRELFDLGLHPELARDGLAQVDVIALGAALLRV